MELKIYFNTQFVILSDDKNTKNSEQYYVCANKTDVLHAISVLENIEIENVELFNSDFTQLFTWFSSEFKYIEAAGGLVCNENNEFLCMLRLGVWDLPKGKLEKNESPENAAIREVEEETGISNISLGKYLCSTWHTYPFKKGIALKQTYWYAMEASKNQLLIPQTEENITELRWIPQSDLEIVYDNTYPSIIDVLTSM